MVLFSFVVSILISSSLGAVTEKDLAKYGISITGTKPVAWKDYVNKNPQIGYQPVLPQAPPPEPCIKRPARACTSYYHECCFSHFDCDQDQNLTCSTFDKCECKPSYFVNPKATGCAEKPRKGLWERCTKEKDNCYTAFAICLNGVCQCKKGFYRAGDMCKPLQYDCPYKTALLKPKGIPWQCNIHANKSECPNGYWCVTPVPGPRAKFLTSPGIEYSYCCPTVPNFVFPKPNEHEFPKKIFQDVCLYGIPAPIPDPLSNCPDGYYKFPGIGAGEVCCPQPCLPHPMVKEPVIEDGKCVD